MVQIRATCVRPLAAQWDYHGMPALLDALDDHSPGVSGRAGVTVGRTVSKDLSDFNYHHDDLPRNGDLRLSGYGRNGNGCATHRFRKTGKSD